MDYLDFDVEVAPRPTGDYDVTVVQSPAGEATAQMAFPYDRLVLQNKIQGLQIALLRSGGSRRAVTATEDQEAVQLLGRDLFAALFSGDVANRLDVSRTMAKSQGKGVRIKLRFGAPELGALPWEYLYDSNRGDYLALGVSTPIVRYLPIPQPIMPFQVAPPLRVLAMASGPRDLGVLDSQRERQRLEMALEPLRSTGIVELEWVRGEFWQDLQESLWHGPWHIFHFVGHGGFSERRGSGVLYLAGADGNAEELSATDLARLLGDHDPLRLALLNSCDTAQGASTDIFSSTAAALVRFGTPAVVAMQFEITDDAAIEFSRVFYSTISNGMPVDSAVAEARKSVALKSHSYEWGTPVLFMRSPDGILFDIPREVLRRHATPIEQAAAAVATTATAAAATTVAPEPQPGAAPPPLASTPPPYSGTPPPPSSAAPAFAAWQYPAWPGAAPTGVPVVGADQNSQVRGRAATSTGSKVVYVGAALFVGVLVLLGVVLMANVIGGLSHLPGVGLSPDHGPPGSAVTVNGHNFGARSSVHLNWDGDSTGYFADADENGAFETTMMVPAAQPGTIRLTASVGQVSYPGSFIVTAADTTVVPGPSLTAEPTSAPTATPQPSVAVATPLINGPASAEVAGAVCQFQATMAAASDTSNRIQDAMDGGSQTQAKVNLGQLSDQVATMKQALATLGTWLPLASLAADYYPALDALLSAISNYVDGTDTSDAAATSGGRIVDLNFRFNDIQSEHAELGSPCWDITGT